jgi:peptide/nickel transport system substrate-binding protein
MSKRGLCMSSNRTSSPGLPSDQDEACTVTELNAHKVSRRTLLQGSAGLAVGLLAGHTAQGAAAQETPKEGGTLTISVAQITSNSHMLHLRHYAGSENLYTRLLANARLVTLDNARTNFVGALAESFEFSTDGKLITYKLRPALTWHDGAPFTAADVDFTYHMIGIPGVGPTLFGSSFNETIVGMKEWIDGTADRISGLKVVDDLTVTFDLFEGVNQTATLALFNQICIAPNHVLSQYLNRDTGATILESPWATTAAHIGLGPFRVIEYVADQYIRYEPFENYYNGKPLLGEVVYRSFVDGTTNAAALQNKEVDVARLPVAEYERFKEFDFLTFNEAKSPSYQGTPFNTRQPYLNKDVRQALMHAIDREAMSQVLYSGAVEPVHTQIDYPGFGESPNLKKYEYDPEKAKALLASGGWDPNRKIRWAVVQVPSTEEQLAYYAAINGYWEAVGVAAEFQVFGQDSTVLWGPGWDFDLYPSSYPIGLPEAVSGHFDPRRASNVSAGFDTPEFRELWDKSYRQHPEEEMKAIIFQLQEVMAEEALGLMVIRAPDIWGLATRVHGLIPNYFPYEYELYDWQLEKVWVD